MCASQVGVTELLYIWLTAAIQTWQTIDFYCCHIDLSARVACEIGLLHKYQLNFSSYYGSGHETVELLLLRQISLYIFVIFSDFINIKDNYLHL